MNHEIFLKSKLNLRTSQKAHFKILSYLVGFADLRSIKFTFAFVF